VCEEKPPQGCAVATVSDKCEVHVLLKVHTSVSLSIFWAHFLTSPLVISRHRLIVPYSEVLG